MNDIKTGASAPATDALTPPRAAEKSCCCTASAATPAKAENAPLVALKDPVCGMTVTPASKHVHLHDGHALYFCSAGCKGKFAVDPAKHLAKAAATSSSAMPAVPEPAIVSAVYTCPVHPVVRLDRPDSCPKHGMALEPEMPSLDEGEDPERIDFRRRVWWTLPLTLTVAFQAMAGHRLQWFEMATQSWIELALTLPVVLWAGWPFFERGAMSIVHRSPNRWTLIGLGTGSAFAYSVVATVAPRVFPASFMSMGRVAAYFEAATVIISLTLLGQRLELKARSQTSAAIRSLLGLAPKTARRLRATRCQCRMSHVACRIPRGAFAPASVELDVQLLDQRTPAVVAAPVHRRQFLG